MCERPVFAVVSWRPPFSCLPPTLPYSLLVPLPSRARSGLARGLGTSGFRGRPRWPSWRLSPASSASWRCEGPSSSFLPPPSSRHPDRAGRALSPRRPRGLLTAPPHHPHCAPHAQVGSALAFPRARPPALRRAGRRRPRPGVAGWARDPGSPPPPARWADGEGLGGRCSRAANVPPLSRLKCAPVGLCVFFSLFFSGVGVSPEADFLHRRSHPFVPSWGSRLLSAICLDQQGRTGSSWQRRLDKVCPRAPPFRPRALLLWGEGRWVSAAASVSVSPHVATVVPLCSAAVRRLHCQRLYGFLLGTAHSNVSGAQCAWGTSWAIANISLKLHDSEFDDEFEFTRVRVPDLRMLRRARRGRRAAAGGPQCNDIIA